MIVVTNRLSVTKGFEKHFEQKFQNRAKLIDHEPGFFRNEIHRLQDLVRDPENGDFVCQKRDHTVYEIKTWWNCFENFTAWTKSESFRQSHSQAPQKDMFARPPRLEICEVFSSTDGPRTNS